MDIDKLILKFTCRGKRPRTTNKIWRKRYYLTSKLMVVAAAAAKSLQSCPTLYDPIDGSPSGSSVPGILQARILEWVAIYR